MKNLALGEGEIIPFASFSHRPSVLMHERASVELVVKIQETCNLNCKYCYMYNLGNKLHSTMPKSAPVELFETIGRRIVEEFQARDPFFVRVILHGGEPMLLPAHQFAKRMTILHDILAEGLSDEQRNRVSFALQTNGTLVTPAWIEQLVKWNIYPGVSIDGPAALNDRNRIDHHGEGSHGRLLEGIAKLRAGLRQAERTGPGALCVIDPTADGAEVFRYLTVELGFDNIDFLLPFMNWDSYDAEVAGGVEAFLVAAFRAWRRTSPRAKVRIFDKALRASVHGGIARKAVSEYINRHFVLVVEADGTFGADESNRPSVEYAFTSRKLHDTGIFQVLATEEFAEAAMAERSLAAECCDCALRDICSSGNTLGRAGFRYSATDGYQRRTVYCEAFAALFAETFATVEGSGRNCYPLEQGELAFAG